MFSILTQLIAYPSFFFKADDILKNVCTIPEGIAGVYLIYAITEKNATSEIIYIGSSGSVNKHGQLTLRKNGGLCHRITNGKETYNEEKVSRSKLWPILMRKQAISMLEIRCWQTFNDGIKLIPAFVEAVLIQEYFDLYKKLPSWNSKF